MKITGESFFIRHGNRYVRIRLADILYIRSFRNYVRIVAAGTVYTPLLSMRQLEEDLPEALFCRVHRSYIVAIGHITSFDHGHVFLGTTEIPLSDHYRKLLPGRLHILFSDVRPSPAARLSLPAVHH